MYKTISVILLLFTVIFAQPLSAQKNEDTSNMDKDRKIAITWTATSIFAGKATFGIEYALKDNIGLRLGTGFMLPINFRSDNLEDVGDDINSLDDEKLKGLDITPEIRFYTNKSKDALEGFFVGLFYRYFRYNLDLSGDFDDDGTNRIGDFNLKLISPFNIGFNLGGQWISAKGFTSSLHFGFGGGIGNVEIRGSNIQGYTTNDYKEIAQDIKEYFEDDEDDLASDPYGTPILESDVTFNDNSVTVKTGNLFTPILRFGFSIGWAF